MTDQRTTLGREALTLLPAAVALIAVLQVATGHGAHQRELLLAGLAVAVTQALPGAILWRLVRPVHGWLVEDLAVGLGIGAAASVVGHLIGIAVGLPLAGGLLPLALAVVLLALPGSRRRVLSREISPLPWAWGALSVITCVGPLLAVLNGFRSPLRWQGYAAPYVDLPFHDALAGEVMHNFPPHYPQVAQEPLTYHWFAHVWTAQVSTISGTPIDVLLWRFNPSLLMVAVPVLVAIVAVRVSGNVWAGPVAAAIAFLLPDLVPWTTTTISTPLSNTMSPTQQFGMLLVVAVIAVVAVRWRDDDARGTLPVLLLLLVIVGGAKGSTLPVLVCGALLATVATAIRRDRARLRRVGLDAALACVVLVVLNVVMFAGGDGGVALDFGRHFVEAAGPSIAGREVSATSGLGILVGVLALSMPLLGPAAGLALPFLRETRTDPVAWFLLGCGAAGLGAATALAHPGGAQRYFYRAGEPAIAIAAAWATVVLFQRVRSAPGLVPKLAATGGVLGLAAIAASYGVGEIGSGLTRVLSALAVFAAVLAAGAWVGSRVTRTGLGGALAIVAAALVAAPSVAAVQSVDRWTPPEVKVSETPLAGGLHSRDLRALRWLHDHSEPRDIVITNDHCRSTLGTTCDRRRFLIAGYAQRRVLIEGWTYTTRASKLYEDYGSNEFADSQFWDQDLLALNDGFIAAPTDAAAARLWDLGVRWMVVWDRVPHAKSYRPWAHRVRRGMSMTIYRLEPAGR